MGLLQGEPPSKGLYEGVGVLDLEAIHKTDGIGCGDYDALALCRVLGPSIAGKDVLSAFDLGYDGVVAALEIGCLGDVTLPGYLDLGGLLLDV